MTREATAHVSPPSSTMSTLAATFGRGTMTAVLPMYAVQHEITEAIAAAVEAADLCRRKFSGQTQASGEHGRMGSLTRCALDV